MDLTEKRSNQKNNRRKGDNKNNNRPDNVYNFFPFFVHKEMITKNQKKIKSLALKRQNNRLPKRQKGNFDLYRFLTLVFLIIAAAFLIFSVWRVYRGRMSVKPELDKLEEELSNLTNKNQELKEEISRFNDPNKLEEMAREKMVYIKPGEEMVIIAPPEKTIELPKKEDKNWWQKLLEKIGF